MSDVVDVAGAIIGNLMLVLGCACLLWLLLFAVILHDSGTEGQEDRRGERMIAANKVDKSVPMAPRVVPVPYDMAYSVPLFSNYVGCPTCEHEVNPNYRYCPNCGQRLAWQEGDK